MTTTAQHPAKTAAAKASPAKKAPGKGAKPVTAKPMTACLCGCGNQTAAKYRPGHDARHCRLLREAFEHGELTREDALAAVAHSALLPLKLGRALDEAARRMAAKNAAKAGPETAA